MCPRTLLLAALATVLAAFAEADSTSHCLFSVINPHGDPELYDFSSLATSDPWQVPDVSDSKSKPGVLFLSVCGPLKGLTKAQCPDVDASACLARQEGGQWRTIVASAAAATANASLVYTGTRLTLILPGHTPCGAGQNYSVHVHLVCNKDSVAAPFFVGLTGCEIQLAWFTAAACPSAEATRACSLPSSGGHWFDLYPLVAEKAYQVSAPDGRVFYLNLCAPVAGGLCPGEKAVACEANKTVSLGRFAENSGLQLAADGLVSRQRGENDTMVEVHFLCNQRAPLVPKPEFLSASNGHAVFRVETPYACPAIPVDCVAYTRQGVKVDISPLRKANSYWIVRDPRVNYTHLLYYINVCGPLARNLPSPCHAGNIGACISSSKPNVPSIPLGVVEHPPRFTKDGDLLLTYRDGADCPDGRNKRKVHISFECSEQERGPEFVVVSGDCVYTFLWKTPTACEAKPNRGDNCQVLDSRMFYSFDLRSLYNDMEDYEVRVDGSLFRVNLCGPLHTPCNGTKNVNVCLARNGSETAIGLRNDKLEYMDGRLSLHLTGEECLPGVTSSVTVILACEHLDPDGPATQPQIFPSGVNDCRYFLVWNHPKACPPYTEVPCTVRMEDGTLYDLSPLSRRSANHIARSRSGQSSGVLINVCRSVVFNRDAACEATSGACLRQGDKFINLGNVQSGPFLDSKVLKLRYEEGALCHAPRGPVHVSATVTFMCDPDALESQPEYLGEFQCDHALFWRTAAACPQRPPSGYNCSVLSPYSKFRFDLSPLAGQDHPATDEFGQHMVLSVCSSVSDPSCPKGIGACQLTASGGLSTGANSSDLKYLPGGTLELRYQGGDACGVGRRRETIIEFFCGAEGSPEGPRVVETLQGCITIVHWHTRFACENPIPCATSLLGHSTDLSSLVRVTQNYRAELQDGRIFFLNICRPLLPKLGLNCGAGAAACVARRSGGTLVEELNIGHATTGPTLTADGALLIYSGGGSCPRRPSVNATTRISFKCDPLAGNGAPKFEKETPDCQFYFSWPTSLVCGPVEEKVGDCKVYSSQLKRFISLDNLGQQVRIGKFTVDLCGRGTDCSGNAVCQRSEDGNWSSYGVLQKAVLHADYLKLHFGGGASCLRNDTYGAEVWLKCDLNNGTGTPRVVLDHSCYAIFEWRTDAVCLQRTVGPTLQPEAADSENQEVQTGHATTAIVALVVTASLLSLGVGAVVVVRRRYPLLCLSWRLPWPSSASHTQVHYSRETLSTY
ncbi:cation-independent mannose-6-phosphate receptor isoform X2 [Neocloeon triangulifer]|uniref:cation-independent mannose-6-phosphate receptor isoform X2 n=1 Tax=Neocloeon triangulifer TaxID=2078957 RepID=UPI00286FA563|nr:cation-independent mannose-6-phosphate receptor isoform X2 [Neocloeon triangulifer]